MYFCTSRKGIPALFFLGQRYYLEHKYKNKSKQRWRCSRFIAGCKAAIFTVDEVVVNNTDTHNHWQFHRRWHNYLFYDNKLHVCLNLVSSFYAHLNITQYYVLQIWAVGQFECFVNGFFIFRVYFDYRLGTCSTYYVLLILGMRYTQSVNFVCIH